MRFGRKPRPAEDPETRRRVVRSQPGSVPRAQFSYYADRRATPSERREPDTTGVIRRDRNYENVSQLEKHRRRLKRRNIWFWLLITAGVFLVGQVMFLQTEAKVVLLDENNKPIASKSAEMYDTSAKNILSKSILNRSKITIDAKGVADELRRSHPEITSAVLTIPFIGSQPTIYATQSPAVFILEQNNEQYALSSNGVVTGSSADRSKPRIVDETGETVRVGSQLLSASQVKFVQTVHYQLSQAGYNIDHFVLPVKKAYEVDARLKDSAFVIRFNLEEDGLEQSGAVIGALRELADDMPGEYLDARVPGRVFYK